MLRERGGDRVSGEGGRDLSEEVFAHARRNPRIRIRAGHAIRLARARLSVCEDRTVEPLHHFHNHRHAELRINRLLQSPPPSPVSRVDARLGKSRRHVGCACGESVCLFTAVSGSRWVGGRMRGRRRHAAPAGVACMMDGSKTWSNPKRWPGSPFMITTPGSNVTQSVDCCVVSMALSGRHRTAT